MNQCNLIQLFLNFISISILTVTVIVYYQQLKTMGHQLETTRQGSNG
jgi:hypothetical protein